MVWVGYSGQDITGYDHMGADTPRCLFTDGYDVKETVEEIRRRCRRLARIKLFREESDKVSGDR